MTEKLKKYLKKEINYAIYEQLKKYKIHQFEKHLDYFYDILKNLLNIPITQGIPDLVECVDPELCFRTRVSRFPV